MKVSFQHANNNYNLLPLLYVTYLSRSISQPAHLHLFFTHFFISHINHLFFCRYTATYHNLVCVCVCARRRLWQCAHVQSSMYRSFKMWYVSRHLPVICPANIFNRWPKCKRMSFSIRKSALKRTLINLYICLLLKATCWIGSKSWQVQEQQFSIRK